MKEQMEQVVGKCVARDMQLTPLKRMVSTDFHYIRNYTY